MRAAWIVPLAAVALAQQPALFDYDRTIPFQYQEELLRSDAKIQVAGAGFESPKGGKVNMVVVRPSGKGPLAAVVYQHGGDQSMLTYVAEAEVLARAGAMSLILEAPGNGSGKWKPGMNSTEVRDYYAEIVICYRRAIDYLESLPSVDARRIAFVGHSYGATMGGVLAGTDRRVKTFVFDGGVPRYTRHIAEVQEDFWVAWRKRFTPGQLANALDVLRPIDPDLYIGAPGHGPILMQCGNFDFLNREACEALHRAASAPKEVRWYDTDHSFADIEAMFDRLEWLERELRLRPVRPLLDQLWASPAKRQTPLPLK